jgi:hypothetical protein
LGTFKLLAGSRPALHGTIPNRHKEGAPQKGAFFILKNIAIQSLV